MKKNIAILMGGYSSEYEISLKSGEVVYKYLPKEKYQIFRAHILKNEWYALTPEEEKIPINKADFSIEVNGEKIKFDCAFNTIHGTPGEDGLIQAYLQNLDIPQTASDYYQAALTFNKRDCISVLKAYGIKTARNFFVDRGDLINEDEIIKKVGLPCFVKANRAGSSFGITKVKSKTEIIPAIKHALKEDNEVIIESFLDGTEVSVGVIKWHNKITALPVTEIISENEFFDFDAKYNGKSQEITPANISTKATKKVQKEAEKIFKVLKLKGLTRSEFIFHNGEPHFIECNACPGLTEASILPQQAKAMNISLTELFNQAIVTAIQH
ncbi:D-alanine--D-alanine ligase [Psychroflexus sp. ALD_RP9]|uniref:D-alanine--D-alanine ligase n=1 Tax=Psychroflexus sp. ALD_RP9 TaxID=2777186 RepID=UPI001A8F6AF0|nr:D-alanine--D-alanine ligase [Psychroflexus sp. ALD_RP9]QSS97358.1 D-alanine--D-alanine ligase [Psychroflexus sp. ALD_RP9]